VDHTDAAETLIIATADHSHSLTFVGGAAMNTRVNGIAFGTRGPMQDANGDYCTFMVYGGGPVMRKRPDLYFADTTNKDYRFEGAMQIGGSTHSCEDVPVYATGPGAQHVHGSMDNTFIFHVMMEAIGANSGTATEKP
jgi:alkaline phosphatase